MDTTEIAFRAMLVPPHHKTRLVACMLHEEAFNGEVGDEMKIPWEG